MRNRKKKEEKREKDETDYLGSIQQSREGGNKTTVTRMREKSVER
jgi:hypothetical protein